MSDREALIALRDAVVAGGFDPARYKGGPKIWRFNAFMDLAEPALESIPELLRSRQNCPISWEAYKGSVDAAIALLEAVLPGWHWGITAPNDETGEPAAFVANPEDAKDGYIGDSDISARALLIATLNALIAETK